MENPFRETLEDLLAIWYHWTAAQRPHLGNARCSPMFRDARPAAGNVHDDDEVVDRLRAFKARAMDHLIDKLPRWEHRVSVELHVANRIGPRVWRNARLSPEQLAEYWEEARYLLGSGCIDAGLLEEADLHPCVARGLAHREIRQ